MNASHPPTKDLNISQENEMVSTRHSGLSNKRHISTSSNQFSKSQNK